MVALLGCGEMRVITPAMRALANLLTGSDDATQTVLNAGFLAALPPLFQTPKMQLRKEVCWAVSNITAGTAAQLDEVMRTNLLPLVIDRLDHDEFEVQKEAAWVLANVMHGYKHERSLHSAGRVRTLVQMGCVPPMVRLLDKNEPAAQSLMLEALGNLLAAGAELGKGENEFVRVFDEAEGIDKLESLQEHQNEKVYEKAVHILETYFGEEEDEDENLAPNNSAGGFAFGAGQALAPAGQVPAFAF
jgi:importin subunit alpha-2